MSEILRYVSDAVVVLVIFFAFAGTVGLLRMPDAFCRMQSSTNIATLGLYGAVIGGLVEGTAAVEAKLIAPAALIVVSVAGICGFAIPGRELAEAVRVWRFVLTICAALAGLFGLTVGLIVLLLHLGGLQSFGLSYLRPFDRGVTGGMVLRPRLVRNKFRDPALKPEDLKNQL